MRELAVDDARNADFDVDDVGRRELVRMTEREGRKLFMTGELSDADRVVARSRLGKLLHVAFPVLGLRFPYQ